MKIDFNLSKKHLLTTFLVFINPGNVLTFLFSPLIFLFLWYIIYVIFIQDLVNFFINLYKNYKCKKLKKYILNNLKMFDIVSSPGFENVKIN